MFDNMGPAGDDGDDGQDVMSPMSDAMGEAMAGEMASALSDHVDRMQAIMDRYGVTGPMAEGDDSG